MTLLLFYGACLAVAAMPWVLLRRRAGRMVTIYALALLLPLMVFDGMVRLTGERARGSVAMPANYWKFDKDIGRMPGDAGPYRATFVEAGSGDPVYAVTYSMGPHGYRKVPSAQSGLPQVVFFGCSYTYGEGVADDEAYPARFGALLNGEVEAVNLGFSTYGPQQMLRLLETGYLATHGIETVIGAFYLAIPDHVNRAAGFYFWNQQSPRYELDGQNVPTFKGLFVGSPLHRLVTLGERVGGGWALIGNAILAAIEPPDQRLRLFAAIVERSDRLIQAQFHIPLVVLLWDLEGGGYDPTLVDAMEAELRSRQVRVVRVSELVGAIPLAEIAIRPGVERHPNARFHDRLGTSLATRWRAGALATAN